MEKPDHIHYTIQGCKVLFPVKAYPSQLSMMERILKCLNRKENCLLESPTGSGKSLALLCAALAWQTKERIKRQMMDDVFCIENVDSFPDSQLTSSLTNVSSPCQSSPCNSKNEMVRTKNDQMNQLSESFKTPEAPTTSHQRVQRQENKSKKPKGVIYIDDDENDDLQDFKPSKKICMGQSFQTANQGVLITKPSLIKIQSPNGVQQEVFINNPSFIQINSGGDIISVPVTLSNNKLPQTTEPKSVLKEAVMNKISKPIKALEEVQKPKAENPTPQSNVKKIPPLPKIYFGTRTHKQVAQIVRELNKTAYKDVPMCILSSRDRTCINGEAKNSPNINEACQELLDAPAGIACSYYHRANRISHEQLSYEKHFSGWDVEDLVKVGSRQGACPYYAIRNLMQDAQLIIAPYNYIMDPAIRSSMNISLKNTVVILDEAHNLEDVAREGSSLTLSLESMAVAVKDLEEFSKDRKEWKTDALHMAQIFSGLCAFIKSNENNLNDYREYDRGCKVWSGEEFLAVLANVGVRADNYKRIEKFNDEIQEEKNKNKEYNKESGITDHISSKYPSSATLFLLKQMSLILNYIFMKNQIYISDYKVVVAKSAAKNDSFASSQSGGWRNKKVSMGWEFHLHIWCLNPGVAFSDISEVIHSLIVTSGTLSPMDSFKSELGMPFPIQLEANHVIKKSQVWVGTMGKGPNGGSLQAIYRNMDTFDFQDELGKLVLEVCKNVPFGVLCFFSSYSAMEKLAKRWEATGLFQEIADHKIIILEPRGRGSKERFQEAMDEFYQAIDNNEGALFLAVCRGKVSEGLDFADNKARAVITVGIPYPNFKDIQVDLKKKFNNIRKVENQSFLSGSDWYEMQAFRALNQALGRCIRHISDWGALIIVDERFQLNQRYTRYLSKWVRSSLRHYSDFQDAMSSLKLFTEENMSAENSLESLGRTPITHATQYSLE